MNKKIIVDIDNTLWYFAPILYEKLKAINNNIPEIEEWKEWNFWEGYISRKDFYKSINEIHINQHKYGVFDDAKEFLEYLKYDMKYEIIIASHRIEASKQSTITWLNKHNLYFDSIHLSNNKTILFNDVTVDGIVDDAPDIIEKANNKNIKAFGIKYPWNHKHHELLDESLTNIKQKMAEGL